jgi:hypothetical protein
MECPRNNRFASPNFVDSCQINQIYKSLPPQSPAETTYCESPIYGPTSIKHIYGLPENDLSARPIYPNQKLCRPIDTLYGHDYTQYQLADFPDGRKKLTGHYKVFPLTDKAIHNLADYSTRILPYMDVTRWTQYPIVRDSSLNNEKQIYPYQ